MSAQKHEPCFGIPGFIADVVVSLSLLTMLVAIFLQLQDSQMTDIFDILFIGLGPRAADRNAVAGTLGALLCERAGGNLGIEGIMTFGAMIGWLAIFRARICGSGCWRRWRRAVWSITWG